MESAYVTYENACRIAKGHDCNNLNTVKEYGLLLKTGAKLVFNPWERRWYVSGYTWNGKDVDDIVKEYVR